MIADREAIVAARLAALREILARHDAAAVQLRTRRDFCWLTLGGLSHVLLATDAAVAPLVVTGDDAFVLAPVNEHARLADEEVDGLPLQLVSLPWWQPGAIDEQVRRLSGGAPVLTEAEIGPELEALRTALTAAEHARLHELATAVREATASALGGLRPGDTEHSLAAAAAAALAERGARLPVVLVAGDGRIERYRHPIPTDHRVERRAMIVVVAERWGLHVAHTEFRELAPMTPEHADAAAALAAVLGAMRERTRPGNTLGDVLDAARAAYAANGIAEQWALHHQGGTIGYGARERIAIPGDATPIRPGMAFAWNPSAVGYKVEETLYLDEAGEQHVLTTTPLPGAEDDG
jgi:Xaa-Pro dipeptidase